MLTSFNDEQWMANFRMSRRTFTHLCNQIRPEIARRNTRLRCAIRVEKRVAITLWRLATNGDYHSIGHMFGVAKGTVCVIVIDMCRAIVKLLLQKYVKCPSGEGIAEVVSGFKWLDMDFSSALGLLMGHTSLY